MLSAVTGYCATAEKILGWQADPQSLSVCEGFYVEPLLVNQRVNGVSIRSDHAEGVLNQRMTLVGHVRLHKDGQLIQADRAHFYRDPKTKQLQKIELFGHVSAQKIGQLLYGDHAILWRDRDQGVVEHAWYRFSRDQQNEVVQGKRRWHGLTSWGHAEKIEQLNADYFRMHQASYAACPPDQVIWQLHAKQLDIDREKEEAYAHHTVLRVKDVPIFYWPYFSYPLNKQRKSGFLMPSYNVTRRSGTDIAIPFYLNLAPNYDLVLTPHWLSLRGVMTEGEGRYLSQHGQGKINLAYINHDDAFASLKNKFARQAIDVSSLGSQRLGGRLQYDHRFDRNWQMQLDYSEVSDDFFYRDLGASLVQSAQNHLLQKIAWQYDDHQVSSQAHFDLTFQKYRTLHPVDEAVVLDQYSQLPRIAYRYQTEFQPYQFNVDAEATRFEWPDDTVANKVDGDRYDVSAALSYPVKRAYGFFTPTLRTKLSHYDLDHANRYLIAALQPVANQKSLTIPYFTADMGLYFDKTWTARYRQTLEPRLFYVYVPNQDQTEVPLFDTGLSNFSEDYLLMPNRFTGRDRLGDTHQLTYMLSSVFEDMLMSRTFMKIGIGQIHYFKDREQTFCYGHNCTGRQYLSPRATVSPWIASYHFSWGDKFSTHMDYAWLHSPRYATVSADYKSKRNFLYNFSYNYAKTNLSVDEAGNYIFRKLRNIKVAGSVPLTKHWYTLGSWGYNLTDDHAHTYFVGGEYDSCCWAMRLVGGQKLLYLDKDRKAHFDKMIYLQFLIKGLSSFGSSPKPLITAALPGYDDQYSKRFTL